MTYGQNINLDTLNKRLAIELVMLKGDTKTDTQLKKLALYHTLNMAANQYCDHIEGFTLSNTFTKRINHFLPSNGFEFISRKGFEICSFFPFNRDTANLSKAIIESFRDSPRHWKLLTQKATDSSYIGCAVIIQNGWCYCTVTGCELADIEVNKNLFEKYSKPPSKKEIDLDKLITDKRS